MTGRGYLVRLTLIVVSIIICGLLTSQSSVADFKGNQPEARKVPWRAGASQRERWLRRNLQHYCSIRLTNARIPLYCKHQKS